MTQGRSALRPLADDNSHYVTTQAGMFCPQLGPHPLNPPFQG